MSDSRTPKNDDDGEQDNDQHPSTGHHDIHGLDLARQIAARASSGRAPLQRRLRKRNSQIEPISSVFADFIDERGWSKQISVRQLLVRWPELVGEVNAQHSKPESYADEILTIRAESTVWATSLRQIAPKLVATLNQTLGQGTVTKVVVVGPQAPSWKHGPRSVPGRGTRDTYG